MATPQKGSTTPRKNSLLGGIFRDKKEDKASKDPPATPTKPTSPLAESSNKETKKKDKDKKDKEKDKDKKDKKGKEKDEGDDEPKSKKTVSFRTRTISAPSGSVVSAPSSTTASSPPKKGGLKKPTLTATSPLSSPRSSPRTSGGFPSPPLNLKNASDAEIALYWASQSMQSMRAGGGSGISGRGQAGRTRAMTVATGAAASPEADSPFTLQPQELRRSKSEPNFPSWDLHLSEWENTQPKKKKSDNEKLIRRHSTTIDGRPPSPGSPTSSNGSNVTTPGRDPLKRRKSLSNLLSSITRLGSSTPTSSHSSLVPGDGSRMDDEELALLLEADKVEYKENSNDLKLCDSTNNKAQRPKAGTITKIVEWLVTPYETDVKAVESSLNGIIVGFRDFTTATDLFQQLVTLFKSNTKPVEARKKRIIYVLYKWIDMYFYVDFKEDQNLLKAFYSFVHGDLGTKFAYWGDKLVKLISRLEYVKAKMEAVLPTTTNKDIDFIEFSPLEVAHQLALLKHHELQRIKLPELLHQTWVKAKPSPDGPSASTNSLVLFAEDFNKISFWVASEIVSTLNVKKRIAVIKNFIMLAKHCKEIRNYSTLMEIISGLNTSYVQRLKKTWKGVPEKSMEMLSEMEDTMSATSNYKKYRELLSTASPPAIPFIAVYQRDLTFIEDGNQTFVENGLINFEKQVMVAGVVADVFKFQKVVYPFEPNPTVQAFLQHLLVLNSQTLYKQSLLCEPRTVTLDAS